MLFVSVSIFSFWMKRNALRGRPSALGESLARETQNHLALGKTLDESDLYSISTLLQYLQGAKRSHIRSKQKERGKGGGRGGGQHGVDI